MQQKRKFLSLFFIACLVGIAVLSVSPFLGVVGAVIWHDGDFSSGSFSPYYTTTGEVSIISGYVKFISGSITYNFTVNNGVTPLVSSDINLTLRMVHSLKIWANFTDGSSTVTECAVGADWLLYSAGGDALFSSNYGKYLSAVTFQYLYAGYSDSFLDDIVFTCYSISLSFTLFPDWESGSTDADWIMKQQQIYSYNGIVLENETYTFSSGFYNVSSTGLSTDSNIAVTGSYSPVIYNHAYSIGALNFNFYPRNSATLVYEGIKIDVAITGGGSMSVTYSVTWQLATTPTPVPQQTFNPPHLAESWFGITDVGTVGNIMALLMIFLVIMLPLAYWFDNIGLFLGLIIATIVTLFSGLMPLWGAILLFLGVFMLIWQQFGSHLGLPPIQQIPVRKTVKKVRNRFANERVTED